MLDALAHCLSLCSPASNTSPKSKAQSIPHERDHARVIAGGTTTQFTVDPKNGRADYTVIVHKAGPVQLAAVVSYHPSRAFACSNSWYIWFDNSTSPYLWSEDVLTKTMKQHIIPQKFELSGGIHTLHVGIREIGARMQSLTITDGQASFIGG